MAGRPARSPLFPYTTLFRSLREKGRLQPGAVSLAHGGLTRGQQGQPAAMFFTDDVQADYAHMKARGAAFTMPPTDVRSEEHTSELQSRLHLVCRPLLEKKKG